MGTPKNLGVDTFPDPLCHFGPPWRPFWILQEVRRCRWWASAPGGTSLVFFLQFLYFDHNELTYSARIIITIQFEVHSEHGEQWWRLYKIYTTISGFITLVLCIWCRKKFYPDFSQVLGGGHIDQTDLEHLSWINRHPKVLKTYWLFLFIHWLMILKE